MMNVNIDKIYDVLAREYPKWRVPVANLVDAQTKDPFKVLVGTLLSAQTRDEVTAVVCQKLFKKIKHYKDLEKIDVKSLQELIYPVSYYRTKAKHLKILARKLREEFDGVVPDEVDELVKLPGVGHKTANVTLATAFKKPAIGVDTHVHRLSNRFGYVKTKTRYETEMKLREILPKKYWVKYNTYLVALGQRICHPTSPKCSMCPLNKLCKKVGVTRSR
ncbi:endonuclease III [Candidatus Woesearchaeota archaeon]|nr:endonuclease III [Candidatus Woesearchaeota archaeon]